MTSFSISIDGLADLDRALAELPKATARNVLVRSLKAAAQPMKEEAASRAPVMTGGLRSSIIITERKPRNYDAGKIAYSQTLSNFGTKSEAVAAMRAARAANPNSFAEIFMGPVRSEVGRFQEFGTQHSAPRPFMRPAWDNNKEKAVDIFKAQLSTEIERAARRLAKRLARMAAKG